MIHIVHDADGKIIAASESANPPRPMARHDLQVGEFEIPAKFNDKKMREYITVLEVDIKGRHLKEKPRG